jgi:hypothetical protein
MYDSAAAGQLKIVAVVKSFGLTIARNPTIVISKSFPAVLMGSATWMVATKATFRARVLRAGFFLPN